MVNREDPAPYLLPDYYVSGRAYGTERRHTDRLVWESQLYRRAGHVDGASIEMRIRDVLETNGWKKAEWPKNTKPNAAWYTYASNDLHYARETTNGFLCRQSVQISPDASVVIFYLEKTETAVPDKATRP